MRFLHHGATERALITPVPAIIGVGGLEVINGARFDQGSRAGPVAKVVGIEPGGDRMAGHHGEDPAGHDTRHAEPERLSHPIGVLAHHEQSPAGGNELFQIGIHGLARGPKRLASCDQQSPLAGGRLAMPRSSAGSQLLEEFCSFSRRIIQEHIGQNRRAGILAGIEDPEREAVGAGALADGGFQHDFAL